MDLTHTQTVEYADANCEGCLWHKDPACLCDVQVTEPMRDDNYDVPPFMVDRFMEAVGAREAGDDSWLFDAWDTAVAHAMVAGITAAYVGDVIGAIEGHPEMVEDLLAKQDTYEVIAKRHGLNRHIVNNVARVLALPVQGKRDQGKRLEPLRERCVALYDEGWSVAEIKAWIPTVYDGPLGVTQVNTWVRRYSQRAATAKAAREAAVAQALGRAS